MVEAVAMRQMKALLEEYHFRVALARAQAEALQAMAQAFFVFVQEAKERLEIAKDEALIASLRGRAFHGEACGSARRGNAASPGHCEPCGMAFQGLTRLDAAMATTPASCEDHPAELDMDGLTAAARKRSDLQNKRA
jgi:hypothetical protein